MEVETGVLDQIKQEFSRHIASGAKTPFNASRGTGEALGKLVRGFEQRRQLGTLTFEEAKILRNADEILENIARFNRAVRRHPAQFSGQISAPHVYDLQTGAITEETGEVPTTVVIPKISQAEADKIISQLNEQFQERVLKKLKRNPPPESSDEEGTTLQDYLASIRAEGPNLPFMDEDSHIDLSKL